MKKFGGALLIASLLVGVTGCNSSQGGEDILEAMTNKGYKILYVDTENYGVNYDEKLKKYEFNYEDNSYEKIDIEERLVAKPEKLEYILYNEDKELKFEVYPFSTDGKETYRVFYSNDDGSYIYDKDYEFTILTDEDDETCRYYFSDKKEEKIETKVCKSSLKDEATDLKEEVEDLLKDIDLEKDDIFTLSSWLNDNKGKEVLEKLQKEYDDQDVLKSDDIQRILDDQGLEVEEDGDNLIIDAVDYSEGKIEAIRDSKGKLELITYITDEDEDYKYAYDVKNDESLVVNEDNETVFNLTTGTKEDKDFSWKDTTASAGKFYLKEFLQNNDITRAELIEYFKEY